MNPTDPMDLGILAIDKHDGGVTAVAHKAAVKGGRVVTGLVKGRTELSRSDRVRKGAA